MNDDYYVEPVGDPYHDGYGLVINVKYYGVFSRKQAQRRVRKLNRKIKQKSRQIKRMRADHDSMRAFFLSPQSWLNNIGFKMKQLRTLRNIRNKIASRWNLTRGGKRKKGGGRFLFWKKKKLPKWLR